MKIFYRQRLSSKIRENKIMESDDVETASAKLYNNIVVAAEKALGKRRSKADRLNHDSHKK